MVLATLMLEPFVKPLVLATLIWEMLHNHWFQQHLFLKCCTTNGFSNLMFGNVVKRMVLATLFLELLENQWFQQHYFWKCSNTTGFYNSVFGNVGNQWF